MITADGWEKLSGYMQSLQAQIPGVRFVTEQFLAHGRRSVARWSMLNGAGARLGEGISYAEYDEQQRLTTMTGFFEAPESSPA